MIWRRLQFQVGTNAVGAWVSVNGRDALPLSRAGNVVGRSLGLDWGTNVLMIATQDAGTNIATRLLTLVRGDNYRAELSSPALGAFANGQSVVASGMVSAVYTDGSTNGLALQGVWVNGIQASCGGADTNGLVAWDTGTNSVISLGADQPQTVMVTVCYTDGTNSVCRQLPLGMVEGYEVVRRSQTRLDGSAFFVRWDSGPTWCTDDGSRWYPHLGALAGWNNRVTTYPSGGTNNVREWGHNLVGGGSGISNLVAESVREVVLWPVDPPMAWDNGWEEAGVPGYGLELGWQSVLGPLGTTGRGDPYRDVTWSELAGTLKFRAPIQYPTNTLVVFTFENMKINEGHQGLAELALQWGGTNLLPVAVTEREGESGIKDVSYLLRVNGGETYTLGTNSFSGLDSRRVSWAGFHNEQRPSVSIVEPVSLADTKKMDPGGVVGVNWDDDDADGGMTSSRSQPVPDSEDTDGVKGEDDLLQVKFAGGTAARRFQLAFDQTHLQLWRDRQKRNGVTPWGQSGAFEFAGGQEASFWVEGIKAHGNLTGTLITLKELTGQNGVADADQVRVTVADPIIYNEAEGAVSKDSLKNYVLSTRTDKRENSAVLKGKDRYYTVNFRKTQREAQLALATADATVIIEGHANYGLGPYFTEGSAAFTAPDAVMNIGNELVGARVGWCMAHFTLPVTPANNPVNRFVIGHEPRKLLFPNIEGIGDGGTFTLRTRPDGSKYHYTFLDVEGGSTGAYEPFVIFAGGSADLPATLKYRSLFLRTCHSGRYYMEPLKRAGATLWYYTGEAGGGRKLVVPRFVEGTTGGETADMLLKSMIAKEDKGPNKEPRINRCALP